MTSASASRVTRSRRSLRLAALLFAGVLAGITALRAQETPTAPAVEPTAKPAAPAPASAAKDVPAQPGASGQKPDAAAAAGQPPTRFEPTEKVRADFDVSFPIDI
jgi:hypothetical protein